MGDRRSGHPAFGLADHSGEDWYLNDPLFSIPAMVATTIVISFAVAWLIDQIKPIRAFI